MDRLGEENQNRGGEKITEDKATQDWLESQQKTQTKGHYRTYWAKFQEFVGMTGDEILADRKLDTEHRWEKKVLAFKGWLVNTKKEATSSATFGAMACRSFFSHHYLPLQYRTADRKKLREHSRKLQDYQFTREDLRKICEVADLTERYVVTAGKSFGLRAGDFLRLSRGDLEPYITREPPISIGEYSTLKENVKAFPFIDSDALPVVKLILEKMGRDGLTKPDSRVLNYKRERQLSRILQRLVQKAGIVTGNKQVRFHNLRKYLADRLSSVMAESKWKQCIGKQISEGAYISAASLREDYARAMAETCFGGRLEEQAKQAAREEYERLFTPEQKQFIEAHTTKRFSKRTDLRKGRKREREEACEDGEHCGNFEQIQEGQLLQKLKEGWTIVKELQNGEVIVSR